MFGSFESKLFRDVNFEDEETKSANGTKYLRTNQEKSVDSVAKISP